MSEEGEVLDPEPGPNAGPEQTDRGFIHNAIELHLRTIGPRDWWRIRQQFPSTFPDGDTGKRKLIRWVADVRAKSGLEGVSRDAGSKVKMRKDIATARAAAARDIPTAPPPAYFKDDAGRRAPTKVRKINFLAEVNEIYADAKKLREFSIKPDPTSEDGFAVKNPVFFDVSIKRRLDTIHAAVSIQREVWDLEKMEKYFTAIIDTIGEASPDLQVEVMRKLHELNNELGMTIHAEP